MKLIKKKCEKPGKEQYTDFFLIYEHDGVLHNLCVKPAFKHDYARMYALAGEQVED